MIFFVYLSLKIKVFNPKKVKIESCRKPTFHINLLNKEFEKKNILTQRIND